MTLPGPYRSTHIERVHLLYICPLQKLPIYQEILRKLALSQSVPSLAPWLHEQRLDGCGAWSASYWAKLLYNTASPDALLVSVADKLHNARAVLADYRRLNDGIWKRFNKEASNSLNRRMRTRLYGGCGRGEQVTAPPNRFARFQVMLPERLRTIRSTSCFALNANRRPHLATLCAESSTLV